MGKSRRILQAFLVVLAVFLFTGQADAAEKGTVTGNNLNVRSAPSLDGSVLGKLQNGDQVQVTGKQNDWLEITYNGQKAFAHKAYISVANQTSGAFAISVNGKAVKPPTTPVMKDNHLLVPFRVISEALGVTVRWDNDTRQVFAKDNGKKVIMTVGSTKVNVAGETVTTPIAPSIQNDYTLIPLRFFSEAFGANVHWDQDTQSVTIKRNENSNTPPPNPSDTPNPIMTNTIQANGTELKKTPIASSSTLATLNKGAKVDVLKNDGNWLYVSYNGEKGYIHSSAVSASQSPEVSGMTLKVTATSLNVRSSGSASSQKLGALTKGQEAKVLEMNDTWAKVQSGSLVGWVHTGYVTLYKNGELIRFLSAPEKIDGNGRTTFVWHKQGNVNTRQIMTDNGVAISTNANSIGSFPFQHPGIKSVNTTDGSYGKQIQVILAPGYHYVVRHSGGDVQLDILPSGLSGKKIVLDAGHGGRDNGATGVTGLLEKTLNLDVTKKLKAKLEAAGATVIESRPDGAYVSLSGRVDIAHQNGGDAFISIHSDSFSATSHGSTSFYHSGENPSWQQSKKMSDLAIHYLSSELGTHNRGSKDQSFHVIRETNIPAILIEVAFLSNPNEEHLLKQDWFREKAADALFKTLQAYYK
ncbi:N-acetylmuramoyl-L-alanine amidase [Aureibacillus halotolerans]|uniref:N-acetylmuramoyl-L-alanine amidase n=1 Tax=Aureibacillus halotolerans TaxID=1508390 RepID=A0A4V3D4P0_9BACI|nr:N-acetylmuramoyl-L-alanine amidase [Aureibacillus halotolerans]TDQ36917.1 N-acetylmuramoyl-L-alanine amidase [Aureibacillus halotolerans]